MDHNSDPYANHDSGTKNRKHLILCDRRNPRDFLEKLQNKGIITGADQCSECEGFSKDKCTEKKHDGVKDQRSYGKWNVEKVADAKRQTGSSACNDSVWEKKRNDSQAINGVAENDGKQVQQDC